MCKYCNGEKSLLIESNNNNIKIRLRFDTDNNQLDVQFGKIDKNNEYINADWSDSKDIKYCPFCGEELKDIN